jgi:F-type H+-transporting ATPase subunit delta
VIGVVLARRYAKAVIDLAREGGILKEVGQDLDRIAGLFADSHELVNIFADPTIESGAKEKVLAEVLQKGGVQELTMKFIHVVLGKGRILGIGEIEMRCQRYQAKRWPWRSRWTRASLEALLPIWAARSTTEALKTS